MKEYPSIRNSSKAPRQEMIAFVKEDGSNIRGKFTHKRGFDLFGSRTQLITEQDAFLGESITVFNAVYREILEREFSDRQYQNIQEITVFGEYFGPNSFAGKHVETDKKEFRLFDILFKHNKQNYEFMLPQDFVKFCDRLIIPYPEVVYRGNLNEEFILNVRQNYLDKPLNEGVVCKGVIRSKSYFGKVWMCKIKTEEYRRKLKESLGDKWEKGWE